MDRLILQRVCELQAKGEPFALITILSTKGSTPRKAGAVMLRERISQTVLDLRCWQWRNTYKAAGLRTSFEQTMSSAFS